MMSVTRKNGYVNLRYSSEFLPPRRAGWLLGQKGEERRRRERRDALRAGRVRPAGPCARESNRVGARLRPLNAPLAVSYNG
jgi:hypothetical protein